MPFSTIVAGVDMISSVDRVLPVVAALARLGSMPVEVVTVLAPGEAEHPVRCEIERRIEQYGLHPTTVYVLHDDAPGRAIAEHVTGRDGALLVFAASSFGAGGQNEVDAATAQILGGVRQPMLIVGPHAEPRLGSLLVTADDERDRRRSHAGRRIVGACVSERLATSRDGGATGHMAGRRAALVV